MHLQFGRDICAEEVQHQIHAWPLLTDVILKIGVEPLVSQVDFRGQCDEHDGHIEGGEVAGFCQPSEAERQWHMLWKVSLPAMSEQGVAGWLGQ